MTHLGLGSSLEEPWGAYWGGGSVTFPGGSINLLGSLGGPMVGGLPITLPRSPEYVAYLTCLGGSKGVRGRNAL